MCFCFLSFVLFRREKYIFEIERVDQKERRLLALHSSAQMVLQCQRRVLSHRPVELPTDRSSMFPLLRLSSRVNWNILDEEQIRASLCVPVEDEDDDDDDGMLRPLSLSL